MSTLISKKNPLAAISLAWASLAALPAAANDSVDAINFDEELPACVSQVKLEKGLEFARIFPDCGYADSELAPVIKAGKYGFVDKSGKLVIDAIYQEAHGFSDELALVKDGGKYGFINAKGQMVIKPQYSDAWGFWEGRAKIAQNGKYGFIDTTGKVVVQPTYDETGNWFEDGLVAVKLGDKYGFIDKNDKFIIAPQFDLAKDFSEGLAAVGMKTGKTGENDQPLYKFGYIDKTGKTAIAVKFDYVSDFLEGAAYVVDGKQAYFIDKKGKPTAMPNY